MAINLQKGQTIDLRKNDKGESVYDLSTVTIGLGWDVRQKQSGFLGKLFGGKEEEYDLDAIAFLLDSNGKVANLGRTISKGGRNIGLYEGDVVFFNSMRHPSGHIWLTGDNRTGAGDGDDEQIVVKFNQLDQRYQKILFVVSIYVYNGSHWASDFGDMGPVISRIIGPKEMASFRRPLGQTGCDLKAA